MSPLREDPTAGRLFSGEELECLIDKFKQVDLDEDGKIGSNELLWLCKKVINSASFSSSNASLPQNDDLLKACREASTEEGQVSMAEYLKVIAKLRRVDSMGSSEGVATKRTSQIVRIAGATNSSQHSIDEEELEQFVLHINQVLPDDPDVGSRLPIDPGTRQLFEECRDGLVLSKLINDSAPDTIDERVLNKGIRLNPFQMTENNNVVINSAKAIGCSVVNIGSQDLIEEREHLVLGLIWQIIKIGLLAKVNLQLHPELYRLLEAGESLEDLLRLPPDEILLRWFNYHLRQAGWHRQVTNFAGDIRDSENYTVLLHQLSPADCSRAALAEADLSRRAELVLQNAARLGCRKYASVKAIISGNPKLNLAFVANLFNHHPGLAPLTEEELGSIDEGLFNSKGDREARALALWMNSLGVQPFVHSLVDDLRDGLVLLQVFDKVRPGSVCWKRVNQRAPLCRFKRIENTNYAIELGRQWAFSLVGIQGADITDGSKTLTLALVWQLMREHIIETLKGLSKDGRSITDADIVTWANDLVRASGSESTMSSFKDTTLRNGLFLLDLLNAMKRNLVNYELVTMGEGEEDAKMNAKYAISVARKLGATIFVLPEDIIEVKPKMILTFVGTLMAIHRSMAAASTS